MSHAQLIELFECQGCNGHVVPPIIQCFHGHLVCKPCREKFNICPMCRRPMGNIRNLAMDELAESVELPCKYHIYGCLETYLFNVKPEHEKYCKFRVYSCPCPRNPCKWTGTLESVFKHISCKHRDDLVRNVGENVKFNVSDFNKPGILFWVMYQSCFDKHFMLVFEKRKVDDLEKIFAAVLLIGTCEEAKDFAYRVELKSNENCVSWEAVPISIQEGITAAVSSLDDLTLNAFNADVFIENYNLDINLIILKKSTAVEQ